MHSAKKTHAVTIVGINGSPRRGGNSDLLLDAALAGAASLGAVTEKLMLDELAFSACRECSQPYFDGCCRFDDDFTRIIYDRVMKADALILASPIFFGSISAQTKTMIDRFQCHWLAKHKGLIKPLPQKRSAVFICVQAAKRPEFFDNARFIVRQFFATIDATYAQELFHTGVEGKGAISKYPEALQAATELGKYLAVAGKRKHA